MDKGMYINVIITLRTTKLIIKCGIMIIYMSFCRFLPSRLAANGIGDIFKSHYIDPWPSWKKIPIRTRDLWFG